MPGDRQQQRCPRPAGTSPDPVRPGRAPDLSRRTPHSKREISFTVDEQERVAALIPSTAVYGIPALGRRRRHPRHLVGSTAAYRTRQTLIWAVVAILTVTACIHPAGLAIRTHRGASESHSSARRNRRADRPLRCAPENSSRSAGHAERPRETPQPDGPPRGTSPSSPSARATPSSSPTPTDGSNGSTTRSEISGFSFAEVRGASPAACSKGPTPIPKPSSSSAPASPARRIPDTDPQLHQGRQALLGLHRYPARPRRRREPLPVHRRPGGHHRAAARPRKTSSASATSSR